MTLSAKCRVCLNGDRLMYAISNTVIQEMWEKLTNARFNANDGKPVLACYICCAQLRKCYKMMKRAVKAEELLTKFIKNGMQQSQHLISAVADLSNDLRYSYVTKPLDYLELKQSETSSMEGIKQENVEKNTEDYEGTYEDVYKEANIEANERANTGDIKEENTQNYEVTAYKGRSEENNEVSVKEEKEDYSDSLQEDSLDLVDSESEIHSDAEHVKNILEQVLEKEVQIVLERIDTDAIMRKRGMEDLPHERNRNNSIEYYEGEHEMFISDVKFKEPKDAYNQCFRESKRSQDLSTNKESELDTLDSIKNELKKNFSCDVCGSKQINKYNMTIHLRKHTGEKPYACNLCDYASAQSGNLIRHMQSHTKEKKFSCPMCMRKFDRTDHFNRHLRTHTEDKNYSCKICLRKFVRKDILTRHLRLHTNRKIFSCDMCAIKFVRKDHLNSHLRTHFGRKQYICDICDFRCSVKSNLRKHIKSIHINN